MQIAQDAVRSVELHVSCNEVSVERRNCKKAKDDGRLILTPSNKT